MPSPVRRLNVVQKRHRDLSKLLLGPGASRETEEFGRKRVGPGVTVLNKIAEFNERTKKMIGCTPGQCGLACDLGKRRRAADGRNDFDDVQSPFEGLMGLVRIRLFHRMKHSTRYYLIEQDMSRKKLIPIPEDVLLRLLAKITRVHRESMVIERMERPTASLHAQRAPKDGNSKIQFIFRKGTYDSGKGRHPIKISYHNIKRD